MSEILPYHRSWDTKSPCYLTVSQTTFLMQAKKLSYLPHTNSPSCHLPYPLCKFIQIGGIIAFFTGIVKDSAWKLPVIPEFIPKIGRFFPEWVAGLVRNQWQLFSGTGGRFVPESTIIWRNGNFNMVFQDKGSLEPMQIISHLRHWIDLREKSFIFIVRKIIRRYKWKIK